MQQSGAPHATLGARRACEALYSEFFLTSLSAITNWHVYRSLCMASGFHLHLSNRNSCPIWLRRFRKGFTLLEHFTNLGRALLYIANHRESREEICVPHRSRPMEECMQSRIRKTRT